MRTALISLVSLIVGGAGVFAYMKWASPEAAPSHYSSKPIVSAMQLPKKQDEEEAPPVAQLAPGDDDEERAIMQNPFQAMRKMQEQMEKEMQAGLGAAAFGDMEVGNEITTKEDAKSVSYEIKDVVGGTLNTSVKNGYLTVSGESKKQMGGFSMQSSFQRTLSLPRNVDPDKMETISGKDSVTLRFPKKS